MSAPSQDPNGSVRGVSELLRSDIESGVFYPREHLVEADLATRYGVKRGAVREAFIQLAAEGLVEREPNKGTRVREVPFVEVIKMVDLRLSIQAVLAEKAAEHATAEDGEWFLQAIERARHSEDREAFNAVLNEISVRVRTLAGMQWQPPALRHFFEQGTKRDFPYEAMREDILADFEQLVVAVVKGDAAGASAALMAHRAKTIDVLRSIERRLPV